MSSSTPAKLPTTITASQMVAYSFVYRIFTVCLLTGPLAILCVPLILRLVSLLLDWLTHQHSLATMILTGVLVPVLSHWVPSVVMNAAPTRKQGVEAVATVRAYGPYLAPVLSVAFCRWFLLPLESILGVSTAGSVPHLAFATTLKLAVGAFLLGCAVSARYIGPPSIVRCSSSPLSINPRSESMRKAFGSWYSLVNFVTGPNKEPSKSKASKSKTPPPRRLQSPEIKSGFAQILLSVAFSCCVAFTSALPFLHETRGDSPLKKAVVIVCCVSMLANLFQTSLDGVNHEIRPQLYRFRASGKDSNFKSILDSTMQSVLFLAILVPIVSIFNPTEWKDNLACFWAAFCITFYLQLFDFFLKVFLCSTPDVQKVVEVCLNDETPEVYLEVVMESLCHSNMDLVKKLSSNSASAVWSDLEREEQKCNESSITMMASTLLYKTVMDEKGPHLEEDMLRLAILTSLRQQKGQGKLFVAPYQVPLCRSLCAFFAGMGEGLIMVTAKKQELVGQWLLAPGAVEMSESAVQIATACLCSSIAKSPSTWRNTRIAALVPTLLNSLRRLETGMLNYAQTLAGIRPSLVEEVDKMPLIKTSCPELMSLLSTLNTCCRVFLEKALEGSRRSEVLASCDQDMVKWCDGKLQAVEFSR